MRVLFLFLSLNFLVSFTSVAQSDTLLTQDLRETWRMKTGDGIVPLVDLADFQGNMLFFTVDLSLHPGELLRIASKEDISIFHNDQLVGIVHGVRWLSVDSLQQVHGKGVTYTLYNSNLFPGTIETAMFTPQGVQPLVDPISIEGRGTGVFRDVWIFTFFFIVAYLAVLYFLYPRSVREFFWITRAISFRELDENLIKTRPLSLVNITFYALLAFLAAWVIGILLILSQNPLASTYFDFNGFWMGVWVWFRFAVVIFILLLAKFILIWVLKELFKISAFINSHYYNYIRLGLLFYVLIAVIVFVSYFTLFKTSPEYYQSVGIVLLSTLILRVVILFFKLMNSSSYSVLHLFSYLCGTELIPLLLIVSVGFNRMM